MQAYLFPYLLPAGPVATFRVANPTCYGLPGRVFGYAFGLRQGSWRTSRIERGFDR